MVRQLRVPAFGAALLLAVSAPSLPAQGAMPVAQEFEKLHFRSIGPATMSGRISDLAVYESNPSVYYVATAHGGLWKTTSNGAMFTPLLQDKGLMSMGDVTISQTNPDLVWVGTGESNNRQSISWGEGVYKSTDGGKTFTHMGLRESKHINRIVIDPMNNDVVFVAATGPLWGSGGERGIYKTTDGGKTWKQVLKGDDDTGANDLVMSYQDNTVLFASMYQRRRTTCCMNGGGPGSAIYKSTDAGETWTKLAGGLPAGPLGRIALDVYRESANILYALIEGPAPAGGRGAAPPGMEAAAGRAGGAGQSLEGPTGLWRSDDAGATWRKVSNANPRPMYFSQVRIDPNTPDRVYLGGVGLHMTVDGGRTIETDAALVTHDDVHAIWINPRNSDHVLIGNDGGLAVSYDMSKTWTFIPNLPVGLFYHVGYDMEVPYNICGGMQDNYNWCGPSASRHGAGIMNYDWFQILGGDGFVAIPDLRDSRWVYTESQDGNIVRRNKVTGESRSIRPNPGNVTPAAAQGESYRFHWDTPLFISPTDNRVLYAAANKVFRSIDRGDSWTVISPDLTSNANRDTVVTMGLKGSDINIARNDGISQWPTIVALAESPVQGGLLYAGTDDGTVSVTRNGGQSWQNVTSKLAGFPAGAYVSEVVPSRFDAGTVYITVDNHRYNDYKPYIWVSTDFGATFRSLVNNLQGEVVRTLTEDTRNRDVLYIGTETGIFLSLDRGQSWRRLKANLPTVRVDEITLHPRDNAMLVATHGRSIFVLDHLEPIQEYAAAQGVADARLFSVPTALQWKYKDDRNDEFWGHQWFVGENPPADAVVQFFVKRPLEDVKVRISSGGRQVRELAVPANRNQPGIQTVCWDMRVEPIAAQTPPAGAAGRGGAAGGGRAGGRGAPPVPGIPVPLPPAGYLPENPCASGDEGGRGGGFGGFGGAGNAGPHVVPGTYTVSLVAGGRVVDSKPMRIIMDPQVQLAGGARESWNATVMGLHELQGRGQAVASRLTAIASQMAEIAGKIGGMGDVPAPVKSQFESLNKDFEAVRVKFGVDSGRAGGAGPAGGGGGGRGFGRGGLDMTNALARTAAIKGAIMGVWETPSAASMRQASAARQALQAAITEANGMLSRANTVSQALKAHNLTLTVPPAP